MTETTTQLELFGALPPGSPPKRAVFHIGMLPLRHDHLVLVLLLGLVTSSVVFALGVERGKHLARVERLLLVAPSSSSQRASAPSPEKEMDDRTPEPSAKPAAQVQKTAPAKRKMAIKVAASGGSKFAVQVVAFKQPTRAQQELQRLQQRGEKAFLVKKSDRVVVLVGPFPSKANAVSKLASLKPRYQDCFVKSL